MSEREAIQEELKKLIVEGLVLEDITPADIGTDDPLFVDGLGLDSIDSLEIAMLLEENYGVSLSEDPETNVAIFASVRTLANFVLENRVT